MHSLMRFCLVPRYKMLVKVPSSSDNNKAVCARFLQAYDSSKKEWQLGKTKVLQCGQGMALFKLQGDVIASTEFSFFS